MIKKRTLIFFTLFLLSPAFVFAQTSSLTFTRPLIQGSQGQDVSALQQILVSQGYLSSQPTGFFGPLTAAALAKFQSAHGIEALGGVGPKTRTLLNSLSLAGQATSAPTDKASLIAALLAQVKILQAQIAALLSSTTPPLPFGWLKPLPGYAPGQIIIGGGSSPLPTCSISAAPASLSAGSSTVLAWSSSYGTSATIDNGVGGSLSGSQSASPTTNTTYTMTVTNGTGSGNCSASVSASDTQAPTVPTGPTATASSSSEIDLSWTASTDNVGVTGYQVFRGNVQVATSMLTAYADTGLTGSTTYTYVVKAFDAVGNVSASSTSAGATTAFAASCAPSSNFLARASGLNNSHKQAYDNLICGLVTDGVWSKLDVLYIFATQNSAAALTNLVSSSFTATPSGSPTFTADSGYTTASNKYVSSNFNFSTNGTNYTQNSASMGGWSGTAAGSATNAWETSTAFGGNTFIVTDDGGVTDISINDTAKQTVTNNSDGSGMFVLVRPDSSTKVLYRNGSSLGSTSRGSAALENGVLQTGNGNSGINRAMFAGGGLTTTDVANFYTRMQTFMNAVGATP
jgi:Putative peptidoglycan binding domain